MYCYLTHCSLHHPTALAGSSSVAGVCSSTTAPAGFSIGSQALSLPAGGVFTPAGELAEVGSTGVKAAPMLLRPSLKGGESPWDGTRTHGSRALNRTGVLVEAALE